MPPEHGLLRWQPWRTLSLPVQPLRRMLVPSEPFDEFPHTSPMVIDMSTGFHFRPEGRGFLLAWNDPEETPGYKSDFRALVHRENPGSCGGPSARSLKICAINPKRAWAGLYEMSPDHHAILGEVAGVPGFYLANGFSGHGVMHAPSTGKILSDLILDGRDECGQTTWNFFPLNDLRRMNCCTRRRSFDSLSASQRKISDKNAAVLYFAGAYQTLLF